MTITQKRTVITLGLFAGILAVAFLLLSLAHVGYAHADGSAAPIDAGVSLDAGSAAPAPVTLPPDPTSDPVGFLNDLRAAWSKGWGVVVGFALYGLIKILGWAGRRSASGTFAFLGKGRVALVIGAAGAILPTLIGAMTGAATWTAFFAAFIAAAAAIWHPAADAQAIADTTARKTA